MVNFKYLNEIFLPVTNISESSKWYKESFGMDITLVDETAHQNIVRLSFKSTSFILVESSIINRYTHIPFNFHTNRIRDLQESLILAGVAVTQIANDDNMLCCDFYDPDGNRIGLCEEHYDSSNQIIEVGGTFLTVRNLDKSVEWYQKTLGYPFHFFSATGAAGYVGATPEYVPDLTIRYAGVDNNIFESAWSRMALVETPLFYPLMHIPYNILSSNAKEDYDILKKKDVKLTEYHEEGNKKWFAFDDLDGNTIGIIQGDENNPSALPDARSRWYTQIERNSFNLE
jgi:catechol 2,3-dioxygenase-like lactoylglutathione lyase family enzyme/predicted enzyme related to lactoylglutathione lyase